MRLIPTELFLSQSAGTAQISAEIFVLEKSRKGIMRSRWRYSQCLRKTNNRKHLLAFHRSVLSLDKLLDRILPRKGKLSAKSETAKSIAGFRFS
jgi:hypothetical protein